MKLTRSLHVAFGKTQKTSLKRALPDSYEKLPQTPRRGCTECYNKNNTQTALSASIREL